MAEFFDQIARILATPMSRVRALRLALGALAILFLTPFGVAQSAGVVCPGVPGGSCPTGKRCCTGTGPNAQNFCCPSPHTCCGNSCCEPSKVCVDGVCRKAEESPVRP